MRFCGAFCLLLTLAGVCAAQDSNFSTGPQYLMNYGSPMFLHPIVTPTLSLSESLPAISPAAEATPAQEQALSSISQAAGLQSPADLTRIYWGGPEVSEVVGETASVLEVSGAAPPSNLPASIVNVGVEETVDAQSLRERGYGVTVSEASSYWKTHKPHAPRVYTNRDIERLHGG